MQPTCTPLLTIALALSAAHALAQPDTLDGARIRFIAGDHAAQNTPISVPCPADAPDGRIVVTNPATGDRLPATLRDGELTFIIDQAAPGTEQTLEVAVEPDAAPAIVRIQRRPDADVLDIRVHGEPFTSFHYGSDLKKPYLWPVLGEGGVHVTRDWPMGDKVESDDHPHQKSLWTAYGDINGVDWWAEGRGSGTQQVRGIRWGDGDAYGWIALDLVWVDADGAPVIDETREYRFYASPADARLLDVRVTFRATYGEALFGDTKEGGLVAVRMHDALTEPNGGVITHADGSVGERDTWGKPSPWCDYAGPIGDAGIRGIAVLDHPDNLRHPTPWHVRGYGLMGANCFGLSYFTDGEQRGDYRLPGDASIIFRYRVYVHSGDAQQAGVAERFADYAGACRAEWE